MSDSSMSAIEVEEYLESRVVRRRLFPRAILVGVASGAIASAFRFALFHADALRESMCLQLPNHLWVRCLGSAFIAILGTWLAIHIGRRDKDSGGSGIPHMKAVLEGHAEMNWARLTGVKFTGALLAIGSGLALGREGPTIQMGGATGFAVADLTGSTGRERRALAAAGAGAGLAAAFNAPLAGVTFVLEELQRDFQPIVFGAALLSAAVATVISRFAAGQNPAFSVPPIATPSLSYLPIFIGIGGVAGLMSVVFNRGLLATASLFAQYRTNRPLGVSVIAGIAAGICYAVSPSLLGGGHGLTEAAIHGRLLLLQAFGFLLARLLFVHCSYATGVPGGIFAPLLSLGALLGVVSFHLASAVLPGGPGVTALVVAGMCGVFSGVVRAPLTGVVLIAEMTGSYEMLLPLLASAFTAYAVAEALRDVPIYEALLQRDARKNDWNLDLGELVTSELEVKPGSPLEGKAIKDLGLGQGVLIVLCRHAGREFVPKAETILHAPMRIVVMSSAAGGLKALREGLTDTL